jgi:hypothetical protein
MEELVYIQHIKNSVFATGCAPTLKVHLYAIRLIVKILLKFALQEKKIFIFFGLDLLICFIPNKLKNLEEKITWWRDKYLNYLISKDWTKIDAWYFLDDDKWNDYLKEHPDRKEYFEKRRKMDFKLLEIYLDQERVDSHFMEKYTKRYM